MINLLRTFVTVFGKELREIVRDRRTLFFLFAPPLLTPLLAVFAGGLILFQLASQMQKGITVAVVNAEAAPALVSALRANAQLRLVNPPADPDAALRDGRVLVLLTIPPDFGERMARQEQVSLGLRTSEGYWLAGLAREGVADTIARYNADLRQARLTARGVDEAWLQPLVVNQESVAPSGLSAAAGGPPGAAAATHPSPFSALFFSLAIASWALSGGLGLIIDATVGEKERNTLAPLLVTTASRTGLALGKLSVVVCISSAVMGLWLLEGLALLAVVAWLPEAASRPALEALGTPELRALGSAALVMAVLLVPFVVGLTAWVMALCAVARSYRESNLLAFGLELGFPVVALLAAFGIGLNPPAPLYLLPFLGTLLAVRDLFQGGLDPAYLALALLASLGYAVLGVAVAGYVFSREWALMRGV